MKQKFIFVSDHPGDLSFYFHLNRIIKEIDNDSEFVLIEIDHPYRKNTDTSFYLEKIYNRIYQLPNVTYEKNIFKGYCNLRKFGKQSNAIIDKEILNQKDTKITVFFSTSAWYPVNKLLNLVSKTSASIIRYEHTDLKNVVSIDLLGSILCFFYTFVGQAFAVKSLKYLKLRRANFYYLFNPPGQIIKVFTPSSHFLKEKKILPFPLLSKYNFDKINQKRAVYFFGDCTLYELYGPNVFGGSERYKEVCTMIFAKIKETHKDCELYYKPHPLDKNELMPGVREAGFTPVYDSKLNAELIFDTTPNHIECVYSFSSLSCISAAFRGLSAYMLYHLLFLDKRIIEIFKETAACQGAPNIYEPYKIDEIGLLNKKKFEFKTENVVLAWNDILKTSG